MILKVTFRIMNDLIVDNLINMRNEGQSREATMETGEEQMSYTKIIQELLH